VKQLTSESISALAGLALSLAASYLPGFAPWYQALDSQRKQLLMLALLAGATAATVAGGMIAGQPVDTAQVVQVFIAALVANQAAYLISPQINVKIDDGFPE